MYYQSTVSLKFSKWKVKVRGDVKIQELVIATVRGGSQTAHIYMLPTYLLCWLLLEARSVQERPRPM